MKIDRHDQAKILSKDEINRLFSLGLKKPRDSEALLLTADPIDDASNEEE